MMNSSIAESFQHAAWRFAAGGLAVLGAAFFGGLLVGAFMNLAAKFVFRRMIPVSLLRFIRIGGGLVIGFLTGMMVFNVGGGLGWGGTGSTKEPASPGATASLAAAKPAAPAPPMRIALLGGGDVKNGAFYLVNGQAPAKKLTELQAALADLKNQPLAPNKLELQIYENSVAHNHAAVVELEQWAIANGFTVSIETKPGNLPASPQAPTS